MSNPQRNIGNMTLNHRISICIIMNFSNNDIHLLKNELYIKRPMLNLNNSNIHLQGSTETD